MRHGEFRRRLQRAGGTLQRREDRDDPLVAGHQLQTRLRGRRSGRQQRFHFTDVTLGRGRHEIRFVGVQLLQRLLQHDVLGAARNLAQARHVARHEQRGGDFGRMNGDRCFSLRTGSQQDKQQDGRERERN